MFLIALRLVNSRWFGWWEAQSSPWQGCLAASASPSTASTTSCKWRSRSQSCNLTRCTSWCRSTSIPNVPRHSEILLCETNFRCGAKLTNKFSGLLKVLLIIFMSIFIGISHYWVIEVWFYNFFRYVRVVYSSLHPLGIPKLLPTSSWMTFDIQIVLNNLTCSKPFSWQHLFLMGLKYFLLIMFSSSCSTSHILVQTKYLKPRRSF